jgi:polyhydroxybutyrate depolymerase
VLLSIVSSQALAGSEPVRREWMVNGVAREALVVAASRESAEGAPVVFVFHGHGGTAKNSARKMSLHTHWPEAVVVYPQGLPTATARDPEGKKPGWQNRAGIEGDRDLKFFDTMLSSLKHDHRLDESRVYVHGHSNGGGMTFLLWAERGEQLAAVAPSGSFGATRLSGQLIPRPVLHIAGERDPIVDFARQQESMAAVRRINGCREASEPWPADEPSKFGRLYPSDTGTPFVSLIHPGGHEYPEAAVPLVVKFFQQHRRPAVSKASAPDPTSTDAPEAGASRPTREPAN